MSDLAIHYLDVLARNPAFEAYTQHLEAEYARRVDRLIDLPDEADPLVVAQHIGVLRGLREALRLPGKLSESQGD